MLRKRNIINNNIAPISFEALVHNYGLTNAQDRSMREVAEASAVNFHAINERQRAIVKKAVSASSVKTTNELQKVETHYAIKNTKREDYKDIAEEKAYASAVDVVAHQDECAYYNARGIRCQSHDAKGPHAGIYDEEAEYNLTFCQRHLNILQSKPAEATRVHDHLNHIFRVYREEVDIVANSDDEYESIEEENIKSEPIEAQKPNIKRSADNVLKGQPVKRLKIAGAPVARPVNDAPLIEEDSISIDQDDLQDDDEDDDEDDEDVDYHAEIEAEKGAKAVDSMDISL